MTWASISEVQNQTGVTVDAETLALASAMIDTFTGADEDMPEDAITVRDRKTLKKATGWQAAWLPSKPGLLTERENVKRVTTDSQSVERADRADALLAPLARREIMNLSWIGTRSTWVPPISAQQKATNFLNEQSDAYGTWMPL